MKEDLSHRTDEKTHYDLVASEYAKSDDHAEPALKKMLGDFIEKQRPEKILDLGCGCGRYRPYPKSEVVVGVDLSRRMLEEAKRQHKSVSLVQADIFHLPFRPGIFDLVYSMSVIGEHVPFSSDVLSEVDSVISNGGFFVFTVVPAHHRLSRPVVVQVAKLFGRRILSRYSASQRRLLKELSKIGYDSVDIREVHAAISHYFVVSRKKAGAIKICRIVPSFPPMLIGGLENHVYELSRTQVLMGHEVHVISPYYEKFLSDGFSFYAVPVRNVGLPLADASLFKRLRFFPCNIIYESLALLKLLILDAKFEYEIIHVHGDWFMAVLAASAKRLLRKPVVLTIHANITGGLWSRLGRLGVKPFLVVDKIIVVSEKIKMELMEAGIPSSKISVKSSGVRLSQFHRTKSNLTNKQAPVLLFVGRIRRVKGVGILIDAFRRVLEVFPNARLLIVGGGPSKDELEQYCSKIGLENSVNFLGPIPHHEIPPYLSMADVFVLPSIENSREKGEGMPTALIEAMAAGVPSIASNVGGIPEIIRHGENGLLVKSGDYVELARAIIEVLSDPLMATKLGFEASETALEYNWFKIADNICKVYAGILFMNNARNLHAQH